MLGLAVQPNIKSIQRFSQAVTMSSGTGTVDVTISAVDLARAVIKITSGSSFGGSYVLGMDFTSSTNVRIYWASDTGGAAIVVKFEVIELGVKPALIQWLTGIASGDQAITSAPMARSVIWPAFIAANGAAANALTVEQTTDTNLAWVTWGSASFYGSLRVAVVTG